MSDNSRRDFFRKIGLGLAGSVTAGSIKAETKTEAMVKNIKPMGFQWETLDPFLFCVHHEDAFPKGNEKMGPDAPLRGRSLGDDFIIKDGWRMYHGKEVPGFPGHPHRGFETITIVRKGMVDHADSLGAAGRYGEGDVQWMTAGSGVQHSEMFPLIKDKEDNPLELFQVWLNLPAKSKMTPPHFKMMWESQIPKYYSEDEKGKKSMVEVIAGSLYGCVAPTPPPGSWASDSKNEVAIYNIHMDFNTQLVLPKAGAGINRVLYFYEGDEIDVQGVKIKKYHSAEIHQEKDLTIKSGGIKTKILILQGRPINETVIQYGPFVMNSKQEIQQAFEDFNKTRFGGWPWPRYDQVHDKSKGRFALHADGSYELPA
jgi:quercetin 2,3-dioxygenase